MKYVPNNIISTSTNITVYVTNTNSINGIEFLIQQEQML